MIFLSVTPSLFTDGTNPSLYQRVRQLIGTWDRKETETNARAKLETDVAPSSVMDTIALAC
jgi:hypothetical protein